jgi:hypothetical protein
MQFALEESRGAANTHKKVNAKTQTVVPKTIRSRERDGRFRVEFGISLDLDKILMSTIAITSAAVTLLKVSQFSVDLESVCRWTFRCFSATAWLAFKMFYSRCGEHGYGKRVNQACSCESI